MFCIMGTAGLVGCVSADVKAETKHHITVDPIKIEVDINLKIDREFDELFGPVDSKKKKNEAS